MQHHYDKPFPLKKYYLIYGGIGAVVFYGILFAFFINAERQALYDQYLLNLADKAGALYQDIERDLLQPYGIRFEEIGAPGRGYREKLRAEIDAIIRADFTLAKVKAFSREGVTLYDHADPAMEGKPYPSLQEQGFQSALSGRTFSKPEVEDGKRFMEVYMPIFSNDGKVAGILELYEDVTRFESQAYAALQKALVAPTLIFILFNVVLYLIVAKADGVILRNTGLLISIRRNMEKYISASAAQAICSSVITDEELFRGQRQEIVIFFSDIRGFTGYSEKNAPEAVVRELNAILALQTGIIEDHGGIIDKFVGDEIMAVFQPDQVVEAVQAALRIVRAIENRPELPFNVGIGIHAGEAVVGSIGTEQRRDYTAIGDTVNTGARLCGASRAGEVLISAAVHARIESDLRARFRNQKSLSLKGKDNLFGIHSNLPV